MKLSYGGLALVAVDYFCLVAAQFPILPQVDLGYEIHQAYSFNETGQTYNFSNIRYAQAPIGDLRFRAPVPPAGRNTTVNDGSVGHICPQAGPIWALVAEQFLAYVAAGNESSFNYTQAQANANAGLGDAAAALADSRSGEDCLFLDVVVPKTVFDNANNRYRKRAYGAPVILWIHGGGYTLGSKNAYGSPAGIISASQANGSPGVVFVTINYRLGAMGWLGGPSLQAAGGVSNAGLHDQRLAIEWVSNNIHLFGGDPNRITLMGESAGGGSIMHQITAYGGNRPVKFQQAIPQSAAWLPTTSQYAQENTTLQYLNLLNVTSIEAARNLTSDQIIGANVLQVAFAQYGSFVYGPTVDGTFVPALPGVSLLSGAYAKNVSLMIGHNTDEGALFAPPIIQTDDDLTLYLTLAFPTIQPAVTSYIVKTLYPAVYDGTYPYENGIQRTIYIITEGIFTCNTNYLARAYDNQTYNYEFQVPPAFHGQDIPYTFAGGSSNGVGLNQTDTFYPAIAGVLQGYITNFAMTGNPNGAGLPYFPMQGMNATLNGLNTTGVSTQIDSTVNARCVWWQKALYS